MHTQEFKIENPGSNVGRGVFIAILAITAGLSVTPILHLIESLGHNIPQNYLSYDYLVAAIGSCILGSSILIWPVDQKERLPLLVLWLAKVGVGLGFMLFYENSYGLDAYEYFRVGTNLHATELTLAIGSGTDNISVLISAIWQTLFFLEPSYHFTKMVFSYAGLVGIYLTYRSLRHLHPTLNPWYVLWIGLFPGILFWSSILGKDPIIFLFCAIYSYACTRFAKTESLGQMILALTALAGVALIRIWMAAILSIPLIFLATVFARRISAKMVTLPLIVLAILMTFAASLDKFGVETSTELLETTAAVSRGWNRGGSAQEVPEFNSLGDIVTFLPLGVTTAMYRPLPGDVLNAFGILASFDGVILLVLSLTTVKLLFRPRLSDRVFWWSLVTTLLWASVYGLIATQNLGSGIRFRLQILPIFLLGLLHARLILQAQQKRCLHPPTQAFPASPRN